MRSATGTDPAGPVSPADGELVPRIGVTTYQENASWRGWHRRACLVPYDLLRPLGAAGTAPVLLPPFGGDAQARRVAAGLDGLVLVGGPDVDPARYRRPREPGTASTEPERDDWELALLRAALDAHIPVLGVCRGMQVLNVARGGTLCQDIAAPAHQPDGNRFGSVPIGLATDRLPGALLGATTTGSCHHHQAVDLLGDGLVATGWSQDGTVESIQLVGREFVLGVQWHPEVGSDPRLFTALAHAAGRRRC